jgi:hypothetical protein
MTDFKGKNPLPLSGNKKMTKGDIPRPLNDPWMHEPKTNCLGFGLKKKRVKNLLRVYGSYLAVFLI